MPPFASLAATICSRRRARVEGVARPPSEIAGQRRGEVGLHQRVAGGERLRRPSGRSPSPPGRGASMSVAVGEDGDVAGSSAKPSRASAIAGAISSSRGFVPYFSRAARSPRPSPARRRRGSCRCWRRHRLAGVVEVHVRWSRPAAPARGSRGRSSSPSAQPDGHEAAAAEVAGRRDRRPPARSRPPPPRRRRCRRPSAPRPRLGGEVLGGDHHAVLALDGAGEAACERRGADEKNERARE